MTTPATMNRTSERFVIDYGDPQEAPAARMVDVDELTAQLTGDIEYSSYGYGELPAAIYRYVPGSPAQLEPLTLAAVKPAQFNEDDLAYPVWQLAGPDGITWATMRCRIDGRV